jgi:hypothetical protein
MINPYLTNGRQSDQSIWEVAAAAGPIAQSSGKGVHRVGTRAVLEDGRVFYYARSSGAAIVAGQLLQTPDQAADHIDLAVGTEVVGSPTITVVLGTATGILEGELAGGYAITNSGTLAAGLTLPIASNPLAAASASPVLTLDAPVPVLFHSDTTVTLQKNLWADVVISGVNQDHMACGVSQVAVAAGTSFPQYFWVQTWGVAGVYQDTNTANGSGMASGTTAGQVEIKGATDQPIGVNLEIGVDGDYTPMFLTIAP